MGIAERREREKKARRSAIIQSARNRFFEQGYEGTKIVDIAEDCELSKGAVYLYFKNKDQLARAVIIDGYDILVKIIEEGAAGDQTGREKVDTILQGFLQFYRDHEQSFYLTIVLESHLHNRLIDGNNWPEYNDRLSRLKSTVRKVLLQGIRDKTIRQDLNPEVMAVTIVNAAAGFFHRIVAYGVLVPEEGVEVEEYVRQFFAILINSLGSVPAPDSRSADGRR